MDNKVIVEKALKGEDIAEDIKDFTEEQKTTLNIDISKAAEAAKTKGLDDLKAISKEKKRREEAAGEDPDKDKTVLTQFREEQVQKAKSRFYSDPRFPVSDAEKSAFEQLFARIDSGKVDADLIFNDLKAAYGAFKNDDLINAKDKVNKLEENAAAFNSAGANASGSISTDDASKYSKAAQELFQMWQKNGMTGPNYSLEKAERQVKNGMSRRL